MTIPETNDVGKPATSVNINSLALSEDAPESLPAFDVEALRLPQDFTLLISAAQKTGNVEIRRPNRQEFFRVHPDWEVSFAMIEQGFTHFVLDPKLLPKYALWAVPKTLIPTINRRGVINLWPIKLPPVDGELDAWNKTARRAAIEARSKWVRLIADRAIGDYLVEVIDHFEEPVWPRDIDNMETLLQIALVGKVISSEDHPVLKRLDGRA